MSPGRIDTSDVASGHNGFVATDAAGLSATSTGTVKSKPQPRQHPRPIISTAGGVVKRKEKAPAGGAGGQGMPGLLIFEANHLVTASTMIVSRITFPTVRIELSSSE